MGVNVSTRPQRQVFSVWRSAHCQHWTPLRPPVARLSVSVLLDAAHSTVAERA